MDEETNEVEPGDRITVQLGTEAAGCEVTGLVMAVSWTSELDTETVLADADGVGYALIYRTEIRIAGIEGWIDITDAEIKKEGDNETAG